MFNTNTRPAQKQLEDQDMQSHFSNSPDKEPQAQGQRSRHQAKFENFLHRFKNYQTHYQVRKEQAAINNSKINDSHLKKYPDISKKSKTLVTEYQTMPVHDRLNKTKTQQNSSMERKKIVTPPSSYQRSKSCERFFTVEKNNQLLSDKFVNEYTEIVAKIKGSRQELKAIQINQDEFQVILMDLGFVQYKVSDDKKVSISQLDYALIQQIEPLLQIQDKERNINCATLLIFLLIIQGLCPQQTFTCQNQQKLRAQQNTLQKQFQGLKYNRDKAILNKRKQQHTQQILDSEVHHPVICSNSIKLAEKRRKSLVEQVHQFIVIDQTSLSTKKVDIHTIWNISELISSSKKSQLQKKLEEQELSECKFKPQLNPITNQISALQRKTVQLSPTTRLFKVKSKGTSVSNQDPNCTFQPHISQRSKFTPLKTDQKENANLDQARLQQIQKARKQQEFKSNMQERGYPKNIKDWTSYVNHHKKSLSQQINPLQKSNQAPPPPPPAQNLESSNKPILFVDVNIGDANDRIVVYPNQSVEQIVQDFALKHKMDPNLTKQFRAMLDNKVRNVLYPICEVQNSQNYDF